MVDVPRFQSLVDSRFITLDRQHGSPSHGRSQRLSANHATQTGRQNPLAGKVSVEVFLGGGDKGLISPLNDSLTADVDPRTGCHLAVHHQASLVEFVEMLPVGPIGNEVAVGDQTRGASS